MSDGFDRDAQTGERWDATSWVAGCAVAGAALVGIAILVFLTALALQPPAWVQVVLGVLLAFGGALFAWLVASALRSRRDGAAPPRR